MFVALHLPQSRISKGLLRGKAVTISVVDCERRGHPRRSQCLRGQSSPAEHSRRRAHGELKRGRSWQPRGQPRGANGVPRRSLTLPTGLVSARRGLGRSGYRSGENEERTCRVKVVVRTTSLTPATANRTGRMFQNRPFRRCSPVRVQTRRSS